MVRDPHVLTSFLYENPQAWPVRMALIEEMVRDGDIARAKALVRESPGDSPMPPEYPMRIHALMTNGVKGLESLPPLLGFLPRTDLEDNGIGTDKKGIQCAPEPNALHITLACQQPHLPKIARHLPYHHGIRSGLPVQHML